VVQNQKMEYYLNGQMNIPENLSKPRKIGIKGMDWNWK